MHKKIFFFFGKKMHCERNGQGERGENLFHLCLIHTFFTQVEEDESSVPRQDARTLLAQFNEQIQPVVELLKVLEDVRLAPEVLEPEPTDIKKYLR